MDALKETLDKVDINEMTLEAELADSTSHNVIGAIVVRRGANKAGSEGRADAHGRIRATLAEVASDVRCRLDNAKLSETQ